MTQPAPATTYKPRNSKIWWAITAATIFAAFAIPAVLAASNALANNPPAKKEPSCLAAERCYQTKPADATLADVSEDADRLASWQRYIGCYRERLYDPMSFAPHTVYEPADGKQPAKNEYERSQTMTWKTGDRRFCAEINFCSRVISEYYDGSPAVRYSQANCRNR